MGSQNTVELIVFIIYLLFMLGIGVYFFIKSKAGGEKTYFLGGRQMGPWVTALSAGASDMSAWVLMGLPTSIYALGLGQVWIAIGLAVGYTLSWIFEASRLRRFSIVSGDAITIPQYLTNRFKEKSKSLQIICAVVFIVAYTIYAASSIVACGTLFNTVLGINPDVAKCVAAIVIIGYTFLGGFSAVCWTDFFQGLIILGAMMLVPIFAATHVASGSFGGLGSDYWSLFTNWKDILSGLAWGFGYFGMPHIIIRFMSLKSQKDVKKSATIGIAWTVLILVFAVGIGIIGRATIGYIDEINDKSLVFIEMTRKWFPMVISGILLSAILAASMSTADSQLLAASSAFASDVYNPVIRKNKATDKEMLWAGRYVVLAVAVAALIMALLPGTGTIMSLVSNAWGVFGAAFGPTILLSLFWKRFNFAGAVAGIVSGAVIDIAWLLLSSYEKLGACNGLYELFPGFILSGIIAIVVTVVTKAPSKEVEDLFDKAVAYKD